MLADQSTTAGDEVIALKAASKFYGSFAALKGVSLTLRAGEVHMLLGENGAGKSTLVSLLTGVNALDEGERYLRGGPAAGMTPAQARAAGINAVMQDFALAPSMSVEENFSLGREWTRHGLVDRRRLRRHLEETFAGIGLDIAPDARVDSLSRAEQQLLEIARAVGGRPGALILDEPTATLSHNEAELLFAIVRRLRAEGWAILYISHRLEEVYALGDVVTTLRDGRMIGHHYLAAVTQQRLLEEMVGREMTNLYPDIPAAPGRTLLAVDGLSTGGSLRNISFHVRAGEIVGIGGLVGSGKADVGRAIFGLKRHWGSTVFDGNPVARPLPRDMLARGLVFLPQDRKGEGLALDRSISENIVIEVLSHRDYTTGPGFVRRQKADGLVRRLVETLRILPAQPGKKVAELSGGNQQKVVLGRALSRDRHVFIFEEPTAGIDVGARMDFYLVLRDLCEAGAGVVLISSDLQELIHLSHRAYIMHNGIVAGELAGDEMSEQAVVACAFGEKHDKRLPLH